MVGLAAEAEAAGAREEGEGDAAGLGCALEQFAEAEDVLAMIDSLPRVYASPAFEAEYERLYTILKQYYEQPHLLDPYLDRMLERCLRLVRDKDAPFAMKHAVFSYMYQIIRVRGYKVVVRHLPHEVSDLVTVLSYLEAQDPADKETWRSRFVLLLWLSIVVIIPFHMSRLDGFTSSETEDGSAKKLTVMERIYNIIKIYALSTDSCAEACAFLASKFLVRSDVKEEYLGAFFEWVMSLEAAPPGALAAAAAVLKHGKRAELLPLAPRLLRWLAARPAPPAAALLHRKYTVKIAQRLGLTFLRPRVAAWRYTRGARSLADSLAPSSGAPTVPPAAGDSSDATDATPDDDDEQDIPQEVEEAAALVVGALGDEHTAVRWAAAKGAGRLAARLPAAAAADVAAAALRLAAPAQREAAWHGACMALAELARRGLLSPAQLGAAVDTLCAALRRDEPRGGGAGGGGGGRAARDAACHVAWALARAYPGPALRPHAPRLAEALIATACFDREINCRRAASAAFQENVGRHGQFPHGIEALTAADFHAVGPRHHAYLVVAPQVARLPAYARPLLRHLLELKVPHWDAAVRDLASQAFAAIAPLAAEYAAEEALPALLAAAERGEPGAVLASGRGLRALARAAPGWAPAPGQLRRALGLPAGLRARGLLRGLAGDQLRPAAAACVLALAEAGLPVPLPVVDEWLELLEESLAHEAAETRARAAAALAAVAGAQLAGSDAERAGRRAALVRRCCARLRDEGAAGLHARCGFATALGSLPASALGEHAELAVGALCECARATDGTRAWAEARRDALLALAALVRALGVAGPPSARPQLARVRDALLRGLRDYTTDTRGDVGAWVREAACAGLAALTLACAAQAPELNTPAAVQAVCAGLAQQAVEKIDRTRALAARLLVQLVHSEPEIAEIPELALLRRQFPAGEAAGGPLWAFPGHTMPRLVPLLAAPAYRRALLAGLAVSAGELTESLVRHTTAALFAWLRGAGRPLAGAVCADVVAVFRAHLHERRVAGPMLNFLDRLLSSGAIAPVLADPESTFAADVLQCVQLELQGGKSIYKLLDAINVLCQLIQVGGGVARRALAQLAVCLCHRDRYVRRCAAARLYEALALYGPDSPVPPRQLDQVMAVLADTDWEQDVALLRPVRNRLCDLMTIKRPVPKQPAAAAAPPPAPEAPEAPPQAPEAPPPAPEAP